MKYKIVIRKVAPRNQYQWYWYCSHMKEKDELLRLFYGGYCDSWDQAMTEAEAHDWEMHHFHVI